jgi:hypothetical protein
MHLKDKHSGRKKRYSFSIPFIQVERGTFRDVQGGKTIFTRSFTPSWNVFLSVMVKASLKFDLSVSHSFFVKSLPFYGN